MQTHQDDTSVSLTSEKHNAQLLTVYVHQGYPSIISIPHGDPARPHQ